MKDELREAIEGADIHCYFNIDDDGSFVPVIIVKGSNFGVHALLQSMFYALAKREGMSMMQVYFQMMREAEEQGLEKRFDGTPTYIVGREPNG